MSQSLNLLNMVPLVLMAGLVLVAVGALAVGVRARAGAGSESTGIPGWQVVLFVAIVAFLLIQVVGYTLAFVWTGGNGRATRATGPTPAPPVRSGTSLGPVVVTADEIDPRMLSLTATVDGQLWSEGWVRDTGWTFPEIVSHLSRSGGVGSGDPGRLAPRPRVRLKPCPTGLLPSGLTSYEHSMHSVNPFPQFRSERNAHIAHTERSDQSGHFLDLESVSKFMMPWPVVARGA
jgi:hypothetical protein